ncbi:MAG: hypothetical protein EOM84_02760 [Sphingobacteriia bacterium]|nr:hypothetical protein [Sphingobacteriia bacterium]
MKKIKKAYQISSVSPFIKGGLRGIFLPIFTLPLRERCHVIMTERVLILSLSPNPSPGGRGGAEKSLCPARHLPLEKGDSEKTYLLTR